MQSEPTYSLRPSGRRPLLIGLAGECLLRAFHEAAKGSCQVLAHSSDVAIRTSRRDAARSLKWIRLKSDWTTVPLERRLEVWGSPAPPPDVRAEYFLSFSWCCEILGLDENEIRRSGPPFAGKRTFRPLGGISNWRHWRENRGLPDPMYRAKYGDSPSPKQTLQQTDVIRQEHELVTV